jgi:hypothetical protein
VQSLGHLEVRPVHLGIVIKLARALNAVVELLTIWRGLVAAVLASSSCRPSFVSVTTVVSRSIRTV